VTGPRYVVAILLAAGVVGSSASTSSGASETGAAQLQACVDRWNWLHYNGWFGHSRNTSIPARVQARPCRLEVAYQPHRHDNRAFRASYFPCRLNRLGAYVCASHAHGLPNDPPRRGHNARYSARSGRIRLDRPPARPVATPKPDWVRRYPVNDGFIVPFDRRGRLRSGLTLRGPTELRCATFASIRHRSRLLGCGAGLHCFVPRLPVRDRMRLACPAAAGSRVFRHGRLRVHP
jgi:hypothetical protein